jgi:arginine N-succinyltransferase
MLLTQTTNVNGTIDLTSAEQKLLHVHAGATVRTLSLNPRKNSNV